MSENRKTQTQSLGVTTASSCEVMSSIPSVSLTQTKIIETGMWRYTDNAVCQPKENKTHTIRGRPIDRPIFGIFFYNRHRPIVLQIRPINIQARLQATRDAALCSKQIAIPLTQRITLWCPPLPANFLKRYLVTPQENGKT